MLNIQTRKRVLCSIDGTIECCEGYAPDSPLHRGLHITEFFHDAGDWQKVWKLAQSTRQFELTYPLKLSGQLYQSTAQWSLIESGGCTYLSAENKRLIPITQNNLATCQNSKSASTVDRFMLSPDDRYKYQYVEEFLSTVRNLFELPAGCHVTIDGNHNIVINCTDPLLAMQVLQAINKIGRPAVNLEAPYVKIWFKGTPICPPLPTKFLLHPALGASLMDIQAQQEEGKRKTIDCPGITLSRNPNGLYIIKDELHLKKLIQLNPDFHVIKWTPGIGGGVGVASGANCLANSGITKEEWVGKPMQCKTPDGKDTWIPEEWEKFSGNLFKHCYIDEFDYRAHFYSGELAEFSVRAWLCLYKGEIHRVVESVGHRLI